MGGVSGPQAGSMSRLRRGVAWVDSLLVASVMLVRVAGVTTQRLLAFGLIVLSTMLLKAGRGRRVVRPMVWGQVRQAGLGLLPFVGLLSVATGFVIVGQTVVLLRQFGAGEVFGTVLVVVLFRELAPLASALLVLLRVGTPTVVELATMRATGEVEALEALSIDPVHYLVVPRVVGLAVAVFCLTVYFLIGALGSGYLFLFLQQVPLGVTAYLNQVAAALSWGDFVLLLLKSVVFGAAVAVITCYQGLSRPLRLEQVPEATTRAVTHCLVVCIAVDLACLGAYWVF